MWQRNLKGTTYSFAFSLQGAMDCPSQTWQKVSNTLNGSTVL